MKRKLRKNWWSLKRLRAYLKWGTPDLVPESPNQKYIVRPDLFLDHAGQKLYRIQALRSFGSVKKGDLGGYVAGLDNLSHQGSCWLFDDSKAYYGARVEGDATMHDLAEAVGVVRLMGNTQMTEKSRAEESATLRGHIIMSGSSLATGRSTLTGRICLTDSVQVTGDATVSTLTGTLVLGGALVIQGSTKICTSREGTFTFKEDIVLDMEDPIMDLGSLSIFKSDDLDGPLIYLKSSDKWYAGGKNLSSEELHIYGQEEGSLGSVYDKYIDLVTVDQKD